MRIIEGTIEEILAYQKQIGQNDKQADNVQLDTDLNFSATNTEQTFSNPTKQSVINNQIKELTLGNDSSSQFKSNNTDNIGNVSLNAELAFLGPNKKLYCDVVDLIKKENKNITLTELRRKYDLPTTIFSFKNLLKQHPDLEYNQLIKRTYFSPKGRMVQTSHKIPNKIITNKHAEALTKLVNYVNTLDEPILYTKACANAGISRFLQLRDKLLIDNRISVSVGGRRIKLIPIKLTDNKAVKSNMTKIVHTKTNDLVDGRIKRMRFINERCKWLQQHYNWNFEKSQKYAIDEWNRKGGIERVKVNGDFSVDNQIEKSFEKVVNQKTFKVSDSFPDLYTVNEHNQKAVIQVIRNMIANGTKIGYFSLKNICNWESGYKWLKFIQTFMDNADKIAAYFNKPNNFETYKQGQFDYIKYNK